MSAQAPGRAGPGARRGAGRRSAAAAVARLHRARPGRDRAPARAPAAARVAGRPARGRAGGAARRRAGSAAQRRTGACACAPPRMCSRRWRRDPVALADLARRTGRPLIADARPGAAAADAWRIETMSPCLNLPHLRQAAADAAPAPVLLARAAPTSISAAGSPARYRVPGPPPELTTRTAGEPSGRA